MGPAVCSSTAFRWSWCTPTCEKSWPRPFLLAFPEWRYSSLQHQVPPPGLAPACSQLVARGSKQDEPYLVLPLLFTELGHRGVLPSTQLTVSSHQNKGHGAAKQVHNPCAQIGSHRGKTMWGCGEKTVSYKWRKGSWQAWQQVAALTLGLHICWTPVPIGGWWSISCCSSCMMTIQHCRQAQR